MLHRHNNFWRNINYITVQWNPQNKFCSLIRDKDKATIYLCTKPNICNLDACALQRKPIINLAGTCLPLCISVSVYIELCLSAKHYNDLFFINKRRLSSFFRRQPLENTSVSLICLPSSPISSYTQIRSPYPSLGREADSIRVLWRDPRP